MRPFVVLTHVSHWFWDFLLGWHPSVFSRILLIFSSSFFFLQLMRLGITIHVCFRYACQLHVVHIWYTSVHTHTLHFFIACFISFFVCVRVCISTQLVSYLFYFLTCMLVSWYCFTLLPYSNSSRHLTLTGGPNRVFDYGTSFCISYLSKYVATLKQ